MNRFNKYLNTMPDWKAIFWGVLVSAAILTSMTWLWV